MDPAEHERPPEPGAATMPATLEPATLQRTPIETPDDSLTLLPPENDPACESGYGFGV